MKRGVWDKRKNATECACIKLTISTSEGMRDRKSASSLLSTAFGLRIFFVNLFIPVERTKALIKLAKLNYNTDPKPLDFTRKSKEVL